MTTRGWTSWSRRRTRRNGRRGARRSGLRCRRSRLRSGRRSCSIMSKDFHTRRWPASPGWVSPHSRCASSALWISCVSGSRRLYVTDMRDELLGRVVSELRELPPVDEAAVGRIVQTVRGQDAGSGGRREHRMWSWWRSQVPLAAAAGLALAAGIGGFVAGDRASRATPTSVVAGDRAPTAESLIHVTSAPPSALRPPLSAVPTQFVLDSPGATRVSL